MRLIGLAMAAAVVLATVPAHAEWKSYKYPEYGFGIDFPAQPTVGKGEYRGRLAGRVPATEITAKVGEVTYKATIVDFTKRLADGPTLIGEAEFLLTQDGDVVTDTSARAEAGPKAQYGRRVVTMLKDGSKRLSEVFLAQGKLYQLDSVISAKGDQGDPEAARFQDSLIFDLNRDWNVPPPLPKDPKDGPRFLKPVKPGEQASK
jgi:hypothetical protein